MAVVQPPKVAIGAAGGAVEELGALLSLRRLTARRIRRSRTATTGRCRRRPGTDTSWRWWRGPVAVTSGWSRHKPGTATLLSYGWRCDRLAQLVWRCHPCHHVGTHHPPKLLQARRSRERRPSRSPEGTQPALESLRLLLCSLPGDEMDTSGFQQQYPIFSHVCPVLQSVVY
jgi:hypothetical protein